jgi:hypothetical protein
VAAQLARLGVFGSMKPPQSRHQPGLLKDNLQKIVQHGKRADSIVKNMLLHSREGSGEHRPADINSLLDESLNLAYHGARAEKGDFNITCSATSMRMRAQSNYFRRRSPARSSI